MQISGISGFGNALFLLMMIVGGALVIPAGQSLFARLFGNADDMHVGGGLMSSLFYGSRMVTALTLGTTKKAMRGMFGLGRKIAGHARQGNKGKGLSGGNDSNKPQVPNFTYTYSTMGDGSGYDVGGNNENNT